MSQLPRRRTFLVQLTSDTDPEAANVEGRVEHVQTGISQRFRSREELFVFLNQVILDEQSSGPPPDHG